MENQHDIVIIGAGIAGLIAARELSATGRDVVVIEARDRIGGRIHTVHDPQCSTPIELGAEFVHGCHPNLIAELDRAGIATFEGSGDQVSVRNRAIVEVDGAMEQVTRLIDSLPEKGPDMTWAALIAGVEPTDEVKQMATGFVEGFNAADANRISVHALRKQAEAENKIGGDRILRPSGGYDGLVRSVYAAIPNARDRVYLNHIATAVHWQRGGVIVHARHGSGVELPPANARQCLITVPLGVLQSGSISFTPRVPPLEAANRMAMGSVVRLVLRFRRRFWESRKGMENLGFLHTDGECFGIWWTQMPLRTPVLTAWTARSGCTTGTDDLAGRAIAELAQVFQMTAAQVAHELVSWHFHDWTADPFARGAYSYVPVDAIDAPDLMTIPVEDTVFFAGEATDTEGHWGTVHAAITSAKRAVQQMLA